MRDFLRVSDRSGDEIRELIRHARGIEQAFRERRALELLNGQRVAMWWDADGFRNRVAFELAATWLGADVTTVPGALGVREEISDIGGYLGNWYDAIVVRTASIESMAELAASTDAMVVNARTTHNHPCEILGDLAFLAAEGRSMGAPISVVFAGEATNLCQSWIEAAAVLPIAVTQVCPPGFEADLDQGDELAHPRVGSVEIAHGFDDRLTTAHVIYTDCWPSNLDQRSRAQFRELQITGEILDRCSQQTVFLPCPPVTRGEEVSDDAMVHDKCAVVEAKRWLLPVQAALLVRELAPESGIVQATVPRV